ncbi:MAG: glycosyltransferase family 4 protein [candidate division KSB1 bacterium]|nr:glycosyltransferase family 4 protein [candidate division KSB1 bacterium]MDZ7272779.1 glycosyltransferase family 4 protein [candidate division KSB1 bacterium]MDZ7284197.1 glycosyltransferase family 4 protein [candidate division KSB1 bacterium]MDZ7297405.1 glycosyltransferase family 4 protein [candidate division KSB1 bacterium]MDZ7306535.1 glycosyltransferase family 4 protein [candidate division KSB1 bacterium]
MSRPRKKVLFIAYIFPPLARAGVHRSVRFARYLPDLGWELTVLTPAERHYPPQSPIDRDLVRKIPPTIKIVTTPVFHGTTGLFRMKNLLRRRRRQTSPAAVRAPRAPLPPRPEPAAATSSAGAGSKRRGVLQKGKDLVYDLLTIPDKDVNWLPYAVAEGWRLHRREKFDLIYSTAPPFTDHLIALWLKKLTGLPWVADFRDPWARAPWKAEILGDSLRGKAATYLERRFVTAADRVILNTEWIRKDFADYYGPPLSRKFRVITNGFDPQDFVQFETGTAPRPHKKLVITHTGALYRKRNPQNFFTACEHLISRHGVSPAELELRFIGTVAPELYSSFECGEALRQVIQVMPPVSHQQALQYQLESDVLLILQPGTSMSVPGKIFEYIGMRKTILAITPPGATADVVRTHNLGLIADPDNLAEIENCLLRLVQDFRRGTLQPPSVNGAFTAYNGVELTRQLHEEFLQCLSNG